MNKRDLLESVFSASVLGKNITAKILLPYEGVHVSVFGGDKTHIGAVSIIGTDGARTDVEFPGHRDGTIAVKWALALESAGFRPVVVECGIHYDDASKSDIAEILKTTDALLEKILTYAAADS